MQRFLWPLGIFLVITVFLAIGLGLNPREVPSPLIGKPAPDFSLPKLGASAPRFSPRDMLGKTWILNVWASWCAPCQEEHPVLVGLADRKLVPIVGLNYKDKAEDATRWLRKLGDPFLTTVADTDGRISIDYGVYGVPETYVIDRDGIIRYKHIGPITTSVVEERLLPLLKSLVP